MSKKSTLPYFKELPKDTILKLYLRYEMDFKMFGYSADEYYAQGRDWQILKFIPFKIMKIG